MQRNNVDLTDIESLLDIVSGKTSKSVISSPVAAFINFYNIMSGNQKMPAHALWAVFKHYNQSDMAFKTFKQHLSKYVFVNSKSFAQIDKVSFLRLEQIAKDLEDRKVPKKYVIDSVKNFLASTQLEPGTNWVEDYILFHWFSDWKKRRRPMSLTSFVNLAKVHLPFKNTSKGIFFGLNDSCHSYLTPARLRALRHRKQSNEEKKQRPKTR